MSVMIGGLFSFPFSLIHVRIAVEVDSYRLHMFYSEMTCWPCELHLKKHTPLKRIKKAGPCVLLLGGQKVTCDGWGLASAPGGEPTSSITCRLLSAATSHSRRCTRITGLFSRRHNPRLVWLKSVLNEPYIKPLEAGTVSPDL